MAIDILRPDSKGRITLGKLAHGVSGFYVKINDSHHITLEPLVEIPAKEKWLFDNPAALQKVQKGLQDAHEGKVKSLGSFLKYLPKDEV